MEHVFSLRAHNAQTESGVSPGSQRSWVLRHCRHADPNPLLDLDSDGDRCCCCFGDFAFGDFDFDFDFGCSSTWSSQSLGSSGSGACATGTAPEPMSLSLAISVRCRASASSACPVRYESSSPSAFRSMVTKRSFLCPPRKSRPLKNPPPASLFLPPQAVLWQPYRRFFLKKPPVQYRRFFFCFSGSLLWYSTFTLLAVFLVTRRANKQTMDAGCFLTG